MANAAVHGGRFSRRMRQRNKFDKRVQAIRCRDCRRLRHHPKVDDLRTWACPCGGISFNETFPLPDEEQIALKLYAREIDEENLLEPAVQEVIEEWKAGKT